MKHVYLLILTNVIFNVIFQPEGLMLEQKRKTVGVGRKLLWIIILILGLSSVFAQETKKAESQPASSVEDTFWGNRGVLYHKPAVPQGAAEEKVKAKPVKITPPGIKAPKPKPVEPPAIKPETKKPPVYLEETKKQPVEEKKEITTPKEEEGTDALRAKLEKTLKQLSLANQKIKELEKKVSVSNITTQTYAVKKGDSLWSIAKKKEIYGNPYKWLLLYHANRDQIYDPNLIFPYMMLLIPRLEEYDNKTLKQQ